MAGFDISTYGMILSSVGDDAVVEGASRMFRKMNMDYWKYSRQSDFSAAYDHFDGSYPSQIVISDYGVYQLYMRQFTSHFRFLEHYVYPITYNLSREPAKDIQDRFDAINKCVRLRYFD